MLALQNAEEMLSLNPQICTLKLYPILWFHSGFNVTITEWLMYLLLPLFFFIRYIQHISRFIYYHK